MPLDVTEWNRNDGFSPGSPIIVNAVGVDLDRSGLPQIGDIGASTGDDSASVLLDMETGERLAHWAELDAAAPGHRSSAAHHPPRGQPAARAPHRGRAPAPRGRGGCSARRADRVRGVPRRPHHRHRRGGGPSTADRGGHRLPGRGRRAARRPVARMGLHRGVRRQPDGPPGGDARRRVRARRRGGAVRSRSPRS